MSEAIPYHKIVVREFGGPEAMQLVQDELLPPKPGFANVKVAAADVGYTDIMARKGEYLFQLRQPFTPGYGLAGVVVDVNDHNSALQPGNHVAACLPEMGAYAEYVSLPTSLLAPVPDGVGLDVAAGMGLNYLTAYGMLHKSARLTAGDAVLIQGAGGGVGEALSQLGALQHLRMYGTASPKDFDRLRQNGVEPIDYHTKDYELELADVSIRAVFDHLGGEHLRKGRRVLAPDGTLVSYAFVGRAGHVLRDTVLGAVQNRLLNVLPGKHTAIFSLPPLVTKDPAWYQAGMEELFGLVKQDAITPRIAHKYDLSEAAAAHRLLEKHEALGKIVLTTTTT